MPEMEPVETGESLFYKQDSVNQSTIKQLRRGKIAREDAIDLHGLTSKEAHQALHDFIVESRQAGLRCVRVVHGKGLGSGSRFPVLKNGVNGWLRQWDEVLAFCSAGNHEGGTGSAWVLLKTRQ
jgi:DNA-nicking Smr family endonuclease